MFYKNNKKGFTLIEVLVGVAVFVLFAMGIYSGIQFVFKVVYQSRLRILETAMLNEQIEIIRNLPFENVGIVNGSPAGTLSRNVIMTRNNVEFVITRTIRNIDDLFDGTIGGTPNDTVPADYKLIEVEITCGTNCNQQVPLTMTTYVAPKLLEGDPTHGALFIEVLDANAVPVQGANVHIVSTSTNPTIDLVDTTDNDGMLKLVDLGEGMDAYDITVSKSGYTTDQTFRPTPTLLHPIKSPASVEAQNVANISFFIDKVSNLSLSTINNSCSAIGNVPVSINGTKVISTEPDVFLVNQNITTNASGNYLLANLVWDNYGFRVTGYDLLGSIPGQAVNLLPGVDQTTQLILGANTANSVVVHVKDKSNNQSLSSATVRLHGGSIDQTKTTGIGFIQQTDWSGGSGQHLVGQDNKYWSDDGKVETNDFVGDVKLTMVGDDYVANGYLESSVFDLGTSVDFVNINWEPLSQPPEAGVDVVRWQIATSNTSTPETWNYLGPDGTANTFYDVENFNINSIHNGNQFLRYKLFLKTENSSFSPTVSNVYFTFTNACTPPGQTYFGNLVSGQEYIVDVTRSGYSPVTDTFVAGDDIVFMVEMVSE